MVCSLNKPHSDKSVSEPNIFDAFLFLGAPLSFLLSAPSIRSKTTSPSGHYCFWSLENSCRGLCFDRLGKPSFKQKIYLRKSFVKGCGEATRFLTSIFIGIACWQVPYWHIKKSRAGQGGYRFLKLLHKIDLV